MQKQVCPPSISLLYFGKRRLSSKNDSTSSCCFEASELLSTAMALKVTWPDGFKFLKFLEMQRDLPPPSAIFSLKSALRGHVGVSRMIPAFDAFKGLSYERSIRGHPDVDSFNQEEKDVKEEPVKVTRRRTTRNESEKRRRDKLNVYITELAAMVPMCASSRKKLDKTTVLQMAVNYMKIHNDLTTSVLAKEPAVQSSFLSGDEVGEILDECMNGFLFALSSNGAVTFISRNVFQLFGHKQEEVIGKNFLDLIHPDDRNLVFNKLSEDPEPVIVHIDASDFQPSKRLPKKHTFDIQMSFGKDGYCPIHVCGYSNCWESSESPNAKNNLKVVSSKKSSEVPGITNFLVAVGLLSSPDYHRLSDLNESCNVEFNARHTMDGKFLYVDPQSIRLTGFWPSELLGTSLYTYVHMEDLQMLGALHESKGISLVDLITTEVFKSGQIQLDGFWCVRAKSETHDIPIYDIEPIKRNESGLDERPVLKDENNDNVLEYGESKSGPYRMRCKDNQWIWLKSRSYVSYNHWNSKPEFFCSTNQVVSSEEGIEGLKNRQVPPRPFEQPTDLGVPPAQAGSATFKDPQESNLMLMTAWANDNSHNLSVPLTLEVTPYVDTDKSQVQERSELSESQQSVSITNEDSASTKTSSVTEDEDNESTSSLVCYLLLKNSGLEFLTGELKVNFSSEKFGKSRTFLFSVIGLALADEKKQNCEKWSLTSVTIFPLHVTCSGELTKMLSISVAEFLCTRVGLSIVGMR
ncbi:predicted protein [Nematostella vectensis]|uniref:Uncharacterized protein n=1 Tax=Nematostella vectensis TaxID=45351 RepID=A7SLJ4_NEMVE|nr:predicted protein [Nematostella vectensis]|eukprot:XP_001627505.1 predicted protein [Nematostella vectensis]